MSHSELTDLKLIGSGAYGVVYRAKHVQLGTVVYKELRIEILHDQYATTFNIVQLNYQTLDFTECYFFLTVWCVAGLWHPTTFHLSPIHFGLLLSQQSTVEL